MKKNLSITLLCAVLPIVGVIIGSYLTYESSEKFFLKQREVELKERSYSRIMGIGRQISQLMRTMYEANILSEYYNFRFKYISKNIDDLNMSKKAYERMLNMIPEFSKLQRELFESLGDVRISYEINPDLNNKIEELYYFKMFNVDSPDFSVVKTRDDLDLWLDDEVEDLKGFIVENLGSKIDNLLPILLEQTRYK